MKIFTDKVKNKQFLCPIFSGNYKYSCEYRVLAILRYLYPLKFNNMIVLDRPDLQDVTHSIGIEVTISVREEDMKTTYAFSMLKRDLDKEKQFKIINNSGYYINDFYYGRYVISTLGNDNIEKKCFQNSILKKVKKLKSYRSKFKNIGLAILFPDIPSFYSEEHLIDWILELSPNCTDFYDFFYIISHRFCIYYNVSSKENDKCLISADEHNALCTIARMTSEKELSLNDVEWN